MKCCCMAEHCCYVWCCCIRLGLTFVLTGANSLLKPFNSGTPPPFCCKAPSFVHLLPIVHPPRPPRGLEILSLRASQVHKIQYVSLSGSHRSVRSAIQRFNEDDQVRVFLLSLREGAAGLTLVRASQVFLLEPALDPAIEQQAIARVHRIGQVRDVCVTRLLVDGTVEMEVMKVRHEG